MTTPWYWLPSYTPLLSMLHFWFLAQTWVSQKNPGIFSEEGNLTELWTLKGFAVEAGCTHQSSLELIILKVTCFSKWVWTFLAPTYKSGTQEFHDRKLRCRCSRSWFECVFEFGHVNKISFHITLIMHNKYLFNAPKVGVAFYYPT